MESNTTIPDFVDRSRLLTIIGVLLLVGGVAVGLLGPVEMYSFYLFSKGGRFHYQGFGFGSFMFANIASQIIGYYLIAIILITLGYGHLKLRQWARVLALAWLWSWLVVGGPLIMVVFFILVGSKDLSFPVALISLIFLGLSYLIFPGLLIRFYKSRNVCKTLETNDTKKAWIETLPIPILVLSSLYSFYLIMFHVLILFNGIFPAFGSFRFGLQGIVLLDISIACLVCITWGTLQRRLWAWWGSVILLGAFMFSTVVTFFRSSYSSILSGLAFPQREMEILDGLPLQGYQFSLLIGIPLFTTWVIALLSKRHFRLDMRV
jgi:MFS family permease